MNFSYTNLLFDKTINVQTELDLTNAIFANKKLNPSKIYSHCEVKTAKCKNYYYFRCFTTQKTDEFNNTMYYYIGESIIIVKCIKKTKPIPVLILLEAKIPQSILFVMKIEVGEKYSTLDVLSFANDYLSDPNMLLSIDMTKISENLQNIKSDQDYYDLVELFKIQRNQIKENKKVMDQIKQNSTISTTEHIDPFTNVYALLCDLNNICSKMDSQFSELNDKFNEFNIQHKRFMKKYNLTKSIQKLDT